MKDLEVLCVGSANLDTIALVDSYPGADERVHANRIVTAGGGPAATAAVTLARLGVRTGLLAVVGDDREGELVIEQLATEGVDVSRIERRPGTATGHAVVVASESQSSRAISVTRAPALNDAVDLTGFSGIVHVDQAGYAAVAHTPPDRLSVDAGNDIPELRLDSVWLYAPTDTQLLRRYPGDTDPARRALGDGASIVVSTSGEKGSQWTSSTVSVHAPAYTGPIRGSTMGAGDVFHGALLAALVDGRSGADALLFANACASLSCRAVDGRSAIPHRAELLTFLSTHRQNIPIPGATS